MIFQLSSPSKTKLAMCESAKIPGTNGDILVIPAKPENLNCLRRLASRKLREFRYIDGVRQPFFVVQV